MAVFWVTQRRIDIVMKPDRTTPHNNQHSEEAHLEAEGVHLGEVGLVELHHAGDGVALVRLLYRAPHWSEKQQSNRWLGRERYRRTSRLQQKQNI
jgi:hypothetical protein